MTALLLTAAAIVCLAGFAFYLLRHPDIGLVDNWRSWPRMASMRVGLGASAVLAFFTAQPQVLVGIFGSLTEEQRIPFAIIVFIGGVALFALARLTRKEKPDAATDPAAE